MAAATTALSSAASLAVALLSVAVFAVVLLIFALLSVALFQMVYANQVTNSLKLLGITFQVFFFVREGPADRFDELRIPHCIIVCFSFIVDCIESLIVQTFQL